MRGSDLKRAIEALGLSGIFPAVDRTTRSRLPMAERFLYHFTMDCVRRLVVISSDISLASLG